MAVREASPPSPRHPEASRSVRARLARSGTGSVAAAPPASTAAASRADCCRRPRFTSRFQWLMLRVRRLGQPRRTEAMPKSVTGCGSGFGSLLLRWLLRRAPCRDEWRPSRLTLSPVEKTEYCDASLSRLAWLVRPARLNRLVRLARLARRASAAAARAPASPDARGCGSVAMSRVSRTGQ